MIVADCFAELCGKVVDLPDCAVAIERRASQEIGIPFGS